MIVILTLSFFVFFVFSTLQRISIFQGGQTQQTVMGNFKVQIRRCVCSTFDVLCHKFWCELSTLELEMGAIALIQANKHAYEHLEIMGTHMQKSKEEEEWLQDFFQLYLFLKKVLPTFRLNMIFVRTMVTIQCRSLVYRRQLYLICFFRKREKKRTYNHITVWDRQAHCI